MEAPLAEAPIPKHRVVRHGPYPELTWTAMLIGYGIGILITVSLGYAALILGFSHEGSELAAILGFGILRGILGRTSIVENNINQTIASGVNSASAGMMFTIPALFILGRTDFNPYLMVAGCVAGSFLGVALIIPLRKQMIDFERLTYPGGVAVATVLKSPGAGVHKAALLLIGIGASAAVSLISHLTGFQYWRVGEMLGLPAYLNATWFVSLMTVGVAFIAGRGGFAFIIGGFVSYWILGPILAQRGLLPPGPFENPHVDLPEIMRVSLFRPVGIGMLVGGAIAGIVLAFPLIINAIRSMQNAARDKSGHSADEMPIRFLYFGIAASLIMLSIVAVYSVQGMGLVRGIIMAVVGTLWIWMAGVILSECIGRTNWSPMSGMTLIGVTILVLIARDLGPNAAIIACVMVGAAMSSAMAQATDLMMDLKTGYLVGARPRKQQIGQFLATWLGPIVIMALIYVLHRHYVLGSDKLPAPQASALAGVMEGILGGDVPVRKYGAGAVLGLLLSATGVGGLGIQVGLGFYLPFSIVLTYTVGMLLRLIVDRVRGPRYSHEVGIPVAAGFIVGEGLMGVGFAVYSVVQPWLAARAA
jgi:putative OPT family oligopeptide transporter